MKELLQQWAELEPKRCRNSETTLGIELLISKTWINLWGNDASIVEALIQLALQQTIESIAWHYEQRWSGTVKIAYVYPHNVTKLIRHEADTHAEALLRAYIEALLVTRAHEERAA